jgi:hypothetical protein
MPDISLQHNIDGVLADATSVSLSDETATFGIRRVATGVIEVLPTAAIASSPDGVYTYDVSGLSGDEYEAVWRVEYPPGVVAYRAQLFSVDAEVIVTGVRLMDVERALAERCGPWYDLESGDGSTTGLVEIPDLASSIQSGEYSDLYVLRRGRYTSGAAVLGFTAADRVRQISEVNLASGQFVVDRAWTLAPAEGEAVEFMALHPTRELRRAALAGIKRCFFLDRLSVSSLGAAVETNLTGAASWIRQPSYVWGVESEETAYTLPQSMPWFTPYTRAGNVWLKLAGYAPLGLLVTALRSASTYVNDMTSLTGPNDDDDTISVDLEYAVAAGHVELWRIAPARLLPAAQVGLQISRKDVADEFTKISLDRVGRKPRSVKFDEPFGWASGNLIQVGG